MLVGISSEDLGVVNLMQKQQKKNSDWQQSSFSGLTGGWFCFKNWSDRMLEKTIVVFILC